MTRAQYQFTIALLFMTTLLTGGATLYFYYSPSDDILTRDIVASNTRAETQGDAQDASAVVAAVGKLIVLPEGEEPTVATVSSLEPLAGQPFFANAKVGYKVLIYTTARKAILYDPEQGKIVEVAPLSIAPLTQ